MLAELVSGEGCAPDEGDGGANPLSRLSKSLLDAGRHRQLAGAARANDAALMHAANAAGSSSAHALLPAMGDHEASFMEAFGRPAQQQQMQQMQQQHMQQQQMQQQQMQQQQMQQQQQQQQQQVQMQQMQVQMQQMQMQQQPTAPAPTGALDGAWAESRQQMPPPPAAPLQAHAHHLAQMRLHPSAAPMMAPQLAMPHLPPNALHPAHAAAIHHAATYPWGAHPPPPHFEPPQFERPPPSHLSEDRSGAEAASAVVSPSQLQGNVDSFPPELSSAHAFPPEPNAEVLARLDAQHAAAWQMEATRREHAQEAEGARALVGEAVGKALEAAAGAAAATAERTPSRPLAGETHPYPFSPFVTSPPPHLHPPPFVTRATFAIGQRLVSDWSAIGHTPSF